MSDIRHWEHWDKDGVAGAIDRYWLEDPGSYETLHRKILARLVQSYLNSPIEKILEVGCGSGLIYGSLVPEIIVNSAYLGVDNSMEMLAIARKRFPTGQFIHGDACGLPFPSDSFDVTLCFEVLGHLPHIQKPINELFRLSSRVTIFTVWISQEDRTITLQEEILGKRFLHRCYPQDEIINSIQQAAQGAPNRIEIRVLSDKCWAFVIVKGADQKGKIQGRRPEIFPFQGLTDSFISQQIELKADLKQTIEELHMTKKMASDQRQVSGDKLQNCQAELEKIQALLSRREMEFEQVHGTLFRRDIELRQAQSELSRLGVQSDALRNNAQRLSDELELSRNRRVVRWLDRVFNTGDLSNDISPAFQQLRDDSFIFTKNLKGYRLQPSINLQQVPYLQYPLDLNRPGLKGILLAPVLELPMLQGLLAIEIVSPSNTIVTQSIFPAVQINEGAPTLFEFPPIQGSDQGRFWLRVFVREIDGPIRIFEWRKYSFMGLGRLKTKPFCGLQFS